MELLGRFIKRISGEAAREKEELRVREEAKKRLEEEKQRKKQEELIVRKEAIAKAVAVDPAIQQKLKDSGYPQEDLNLEEEITRIESNVKARVVYGKFPRGIKIKEKNLYPEDIDFVYCGDLKTMLNVNTTLATIPDFISPLGIVKSALFRSKTGGTYLSMVNHPNNEDMVFAYSFAQQFADPFGRPSRRIDLYFLLPKEDSYKLMTLVRKNPEIAEKFFKLGAEGADGTSTSPAIGRIKSSALSIVNLDRIDQEKILKNDSDSIFSAFKANVNGELEHFNVTHA